MVIYCMTSIYRISYFISTALILLSVPAAVLKATLIEQPIEEQQEEQLTDDSETEEEMEYEEVESKSGTVPMAYSEGDVGDIQPQTRLRKTRSHDHD